MHEKQIYNKNKKNRKKYTELGGVVSQIGRRSPPPLRGGVKKYHWTWGSSGVNFHYLYPYYNLEDDINNLTSQFNSRWYYITTIIISLCKNHNTISTVEKNQLCSNI